MARTLAQLRTLVQANCNRPDKTAVVDAGLNFGLDELTRRHTWRARRSEVPVAIAMDDLSFTVPDGLTHVSDIRVMNSDGIMVHKLCVRAKNTLIRDYPQLTHSNISGTPAYGYEEAGIVYFFPKAAQVFTMLVTGDTQGGSMVDDTDGPGIEGVDEALVAYATAYLFRSIQQNEEAGVWEMNFERRAQTAMRDDKRRALEERQLEPFRPSDELTIVDPIKDPFYGQG